MEQTNMWTQAQLETTGRGEVPLVQPQTPEQSSPGVWFLLVSVDDLSTAKPSALLGCQWQKQQAPSA